MQKLYQDQFSRRGVNRRRIPPPCPVPPEKPVSYTHLDVYKRQGGGKVAYRLHQNIIARIVYFAQDYMKEIKDRAHHAHQCQLLNKFFVPFHIPTPTVRMHNTDVQIYNISS